MLPIYIHHFACFMGSVKNMMGQPIQMGWPVLWQTGQPIQTGQLYSYWWNRWNSLSRWESHSWSRRDSLDRRDSYVDVLTVSHLYLSLTKHSSLANGTTRKAVPSRRLSLLPQDQLSRLYRLSCLSHHVLD